MIRRMDIAVLLKRAAAVGMVVAAMSIGGCGGSSKHSQTATATGTGTSAAAHTAAEPPLTATAPPTVVATGIPFPENVAVDAHGGLWVVSATLSRTPSEGVWYVPPGGRPRHVGLTGATALLWLGNQVYEGDITSPNKGRVSLLEDFTGDGFARRRVLLADLPVGSRVIGSIVQGPDGRLFIGLAALGDTSGPPGHVMSFAASGGTPAIEATGLRTDYGLAFWGRRLLVTVNGPDLAGKSPDELQSFVPGEQVVDFGFPKCYGQGGPACAGFPAPLAKLPSHATPEGVAVKGDVAFIAAYGSAVPQYPTPTEILRVDLRTGRVNVFWRSPVPHDLIGGLAIGPDGNLYVPLAISGKVVRFDL
jgi:glucose/arabinose dehydrogenase